MIWVCLISKDKYTNLTKAFLHFTRIETNEHKCLSNFLLFESMWEIAVLCRECSTSESALVHAGLVRRTSLETNANPVWPRLISVLLYEISLHDFLFLSFWSGRWLLASLGTLPSSYNGGMTAQILVVLFLAIGWTSGVPKMWCSCSHLMWPCSTKPPKEHQSVFLVTWPLFCFVLFCS